MKKRFLSVLLCLIMALGLLPSAAFAEETEPLTITSVDVQIPAPKVGDTVSFTAAYVSTPANSVEQYYNGSSPALFWHKLSEADFDIDYVLDARSDSVKAQIIALSMIPLSDGETFQAGYYYNTARTFIVKILTHPHILP